MPRILAIDYGLKRTGIAVTDPGQIISTALETVDTSSLFEFLKKYFLKEAVETVVVGKPVTLTGQSTDATKPAHDFAVRLKSLYPGMAVEEYDERFTSKMALESMIAAGSTKKQRREKGNIDKMSAVILLQSYMEYLEHKKRISGQQQQQ